LDAFAQQTHPNNTIYLFFQGAYVDLDTTIQNFASTLEADFFGVADLTGVTGFIQAQGGPEAARYPRAISMGIALLSPIVDRLPQRDDRNVAMLYRHHAYDVVNLRLDEMSLRMAGLLQRAGYNALPVPASRRVNDERISAFFSHKLAAHLAGLGWIGKSCLLITPQAGPRVRWTSILTDAPLCPTGTPMEERCGDCTCCFDICPVQAFTGRAFREDEPREARFDAHKCENYFKEMEQAGRLPVCGMCLYVCPNGQK
jgi:epoxyqueuosine reductase